MKRLLSAVAATAVLGGCHWHSRAWLAQHADDKKPTIVADTQPVVRQEGEPGGAPKAEPKVHAWSRASASAPMSATSTGSSDGRTVGMFLMANDVNLSFAKVALINSTNDDVRNFARRVITDHTQLVLTIRSLVADQDMSPAEDNASRDLRDFSTLQRDSLRALTGRAFDSTYVAMELERHHAILAMIDDVLLPRARSAELREMLASSRPIIAAHVAHAEQLQATLAKR